MSQFAQGGELPLVSPNLIGARVKLSPLGSIRNPHLAQRQGTVIGSSRLNGSVRVLFDERKTPISLHRDYIESIVVDLDGKSEI